MIFLQLNHYDPECKHGQQDEPCEEALEALALRRENHLHSQSTPVLVRDKDIVCGFGVHIPYILMPVHKVVMPVQEEKAEVGQEEECILVREDIWVGARAALPHMLVTDAPEEKSRVEHVDRHENDANGHFRLGCIVTPGKAQHDRETGEDLPLGYRVLDEPVSQAAICKPVGHL